MGNLYTHYVKTRGIQYLIGLFLIISPGIIKQGFTRVEYAAFSGSNCQACHVGPIGGFGRRPTSPSDPGFITDKFFMSGDFQFLALYDQRDPQDNRFVMFPMEGALHFGFDLKDNITMVASQDFGMLREAYAMIQNHNKNMYARAGYFSLPFGLGFADHTAFIKEGRVESGPRSFEERGLGAGLFSVRYKDSGMEAGLSGRPWFLNLAVTSGVVGQEERTFPSSQGGTKKAFTRRAGFITDHVSLGASMYTNDNEVLDRRILRYGFFGWLKAGDWALLFEHDEGEEEQFTVTGSTQMSASYAELIYGFPMTEEKWPSFAKVRYERLDPNRSLDNNLLQRWIFSLRTNPHDNVAVEGIYRQNKEEPTELKNDDIFVLTHLFF